MKINQLESHLVEHQLRLMVPRMSLRPGHLRIGQREVTLFFAFDVEAAPVTHLHQLPPRERGLAGLQSN